MKMRKIKKVLKKILVGIFLAEMAFFAMLGLTREPPLIPHKILNQRENKFLDILTFVVEVPLVGERLPSEQELEAIANHLLGSSPPKRSWVHFYLPGTVPSDWEYGTVPSDWEYATGHYLPEREGSVLVPFAHFRTDYEEDGVW